MIKNNKTTVIFDFWETLFFSQPEQTERINQVRLERLFKAITQNGYDYSLEQVTQDFNRAWHEISQIRQDQLVDIGLKGHTKLIASIVAPEKLNTPALREDIMQALVFPLQQWVKPMPGATKTLKSLDDHINIGLISNTGIDSSSVLKQLLEHYNMQHYFKSLIFSDIIGYLKPHPAVFRKSLQQLGALAENAIMVGDTINADILGGHLMGLRTVLFRKNGFHSVEPFPEIEDGQILAPDYIITDLDEILSDIVKI